jgi:two-component system, LytTR family, response regulator
MLHTHSRPSDSSESFPLARGRAGRIGTIVGTREPLLRRRLLDLLREERDFEVLAECASGEEAAELVRRLCPDVLIVDAGLPRLNDIDSVRERDCDGPPALIVVAASMQDAQTAVDLGAIDCLLQPLERSRVERGLNRIRSRVRREQTIAIGERLSSLLSALRSAADYPTRLPVVSEGRVVFLEVDEIDWIEGAGNYVRIRCGARCFRLRETLARLEARLDPGRFRRVHRGAIVNVARVRELVPLAGGSATLVLEGGATLRMSRSYRDAFAWPGARDAGGFEEPQAALEAEARGRSASDGSQPPGEPA